jgi:hypothetical protein
MLQNIMNKTERDKCISRIQTFVKRNKKGHLRTKLEVIDYLDEVLSCSTKYHLTFHNTIKRIYGWRDYSRLFTNFMVIIYFPYYSNALICSRATAQDIPYVLSILNNSFKEKPITFKYCITGQMFDSPQIIISLADPNSIPLENGKMLGSQFKEY